jgi:hypothetical protein
MACGAEKVAFVASDRRIVVRAHWIVGAKLQAFESTHGKRRDIMRCLRQSAEGALGTRTCRVDEDTKPVRSVCAISGDSVYALFERTQRVAAIKRDLLHNRV